MIAASHVCGNVAFIAELRLFSGIKIIKTETIEAIHDKDEGSMQNVGTLMTELITTINYALFY